MKVVCTVHKTDQLCMCQQICSWTNENIRQTFIFQFVLKISNWLLKECSPFDHGVYEQV